VAALLPDLIQNVVDCFNSILKGTRIEEMVKSKGLIKAIGSGSKSDYANLKGHLILIIAFLDMISSSSFKSKLIKQQFIQAISFMIDNSESQKNNIVIDEFRRCLFLVTEAIAKHNKTLIQQNKDII
jgi:hypothetical protein